MNSKHVIRAMQEYAAILNALNEGGVVRTYNSPVGDYTEWLVSKKLDLNLEGNSKADYDAVGRNDGKKYQIKGCWMHKGRTRRQLSVIRDYEKHSFDYLIAVVFGEDFSVKEAYKIPHEVIADYYHYQKHLNGILIVIKDVLIKDTRVIDITDMLT